MGNIQEMGENAAIFAINKLWPRILISFVIFKLLGRKLKKIYIDQVLTVLMFYTR